MPDPRLMVKELLRGLIPHSRRPQLRKWYNLATWRLYAGDTVGCTCCEGRFRRFRPWVDDRGRRWTMCPRCGSLGRQRVDWLFLAERTDLLRRELRLLHVAPEFCLQQRLERLPNLSYLTADYDSALAMERMDITNIHYADGSFDCIVCNHVLEHVQDDRKAMSELFRVLKPSGWALLQTPIDRSRSETFEDPTVTDPRERKRLFGQHDHVRVYGCDYVRRLEEAGFSVTVDSFVRDLAASEVGRFGLDVEEEIYLCRKEPGRQPSHTEAGSSGSA